ncbi:flagellar motor protein MotB [Vibrio diazotrophicus]|uniref:Chemotaxis protein n=1 Tax=Vibrio diazotrophicus TaxID=685 RepID=A0A329EFD0_VIBDI|nr:flagellar motor protein MotB [Vibrio diazotrophicus]PNH95460.1 chemotaxis protein [Vibrio diazotrophicus]PNI02088.1 chemotaxis protein [Vibrio diazotrophicus]RAS62833.1 chemotaxis protein MotB [Vibrio diazotrophicus]
MQKEHIVFKRAKAHEHDEYHGGAWKVAFADFMIALMALFLVLWIMQVSNEKERQAIVAQIAKASIFESAGNPFDTSQSLSPIDLETNSSTVPSKADSNHTVTSFYSGDGEGPESDSLIDGTFDTQEELALLAKVIENMIKQINAEGNVFVSVTPQGLRIVLQDDFRQHMFDRGGTELTPYFEDLLLALAPIFQRVKNSLIISGHTDSVAFKRAFSHNTNWELSANRANIARQTLVAGGMPEERVLQVTGMSNRALLNPENPNGSENRRIELFILTTTASLVLETLFKSEDNELEKAKDKADFNQPVLRQEAINYPVEVDNTNRNLQKS